MLLGALPTSCWAEAVPVAAVPSASEAWPRLGNRRCRCCPGRQDGRLGKVEECILEGSVGQPDPD
jgi:hypothetical protein